MRAGGDTIDTIDPTTEEPIGRIRFSTIEDVDRAVRAAQAAFPAWSAVPVSERCAVLYRLRDALRDSSEQFASLIAAEVGSPLWFSRRIGLPLPIQNLDLAIKAAEQMFEEEKMIGTSLVLREPYGVVAAITPWNAPVHQIVAKVGAALAAGCTVVLKPSEFAARTAQLFAELVQEAGVPAGAFNMVFGGPDIGEALVSHSLIDVVSFTGSNAVGQKVAETAAQGVKKVTLELGGKSATILLDDCDLEKAAEVVPGLCFANSGQVCVSQSRLLVPRHLLAQTEHALVNATASWSIGPPLEPNTRLGPLVGKSQYDRVRRYIEIALAEKARLVCGGLERPAGFSKGFFVRPTIFSDVTPDMLIAREEIFGPVLSILPYDDIDEAVAISNMLPYGLSGGVWSADVHRATMVARRMQTGQIAINGAPQNLAAPFGGYKQSGYGRENGRYGVEEFLQIKAIHGAA